MKQEPLMPLEVLWQTRTIIAALLIGEGLALVLALAPGANEDRWVYFGLASLMIQWITLLTLSALFVFRRQLSSLPLNQLAPLVVLILVACGWLVGSFAWALFRDVWPLVLDSAFGFFVRLTGIGLTVGLLIMAALQNHWRIKLLALRAKQAELESLQARTHPHFLFNTLNTGAALVHARPDAAEQLLLDLSDLFRAALTGPSQISLAEEIDLTRRYLAIEELRLGNRLSVRWETPKPLPDAQLPSLSLQPLVENAVRHGVERLIDGGVIDIFVTSDEEFMHITVQNEMPATGGNGGHGVGLASVGQRIEHMTDGAGKLQTEVVGSRHIATIKLPLRPAAQPQVTTS